MKWNLQKKYFINGVILIFIALLSVTYLPVVVKINIENYVYYQIEFFALCAASIFFLFSPKYYKEQVLTIFFAIFLYLLYSKLFYLF